MRISTLAVLGCVLLGSALAVGAEEKGAVRFDNTKGITEPVVVQKVAPVYPEAARNARVQGTVILDATLDTEGRVTDVRVTEGADPRLDKASADALRQWTYKPAHDKNGRPVAVVFKVTVRFVLN